MVVKKDQETADPDSEHDGDQGDSSRSERESTKSAECQPAEHEGGDVDFQTYILDEVRQCVEKAKASYSRKPAN